MESVIKEISRSEYLKLRHKYDNLDFVEYGSWPSFIEDLVMWCPSTYLLLYKRRQIGTTKPTTYHVMVTNEVNIAKDVITVAREKKTFITTELWVSYNVV